MQVKKLVGIRIAWSGNETKLWNDLGIRLEWSGNETKRSGNETRNVARRGNLLGVSDRQARHH